MAGEIFISYRRADAAWARLLHSQLHAEGVEAWYDALVGPGEDWRVATAKALEASHIFVLLFSENAAQSSDIAKELAAATLEKKLIVPVRLQNIAPKGAFLYELASRNWINAYEDTEAKLAELAKGLAQHVRTAGRDPTLLPFERDPGNNRAASREKRSRLALIGAAAMAVVAGCAAAAFWFWPARHWTVENSRPFISSLELEGEPAFSPDGKILAYTSGLEGGQRKIYVRNLSGGNGVKITNDSFDDASPTWSPDGARLAYVAIQPGQPCHFMIATIPAGETREAGRCAAAESSAISWQPGTSYIYSVERSGLKGDIIWRFDLDTGARQKIVQMKALRDVITSLHCSPDGKRLIYLLRGDGIVVRDIAKASEEMPGNIVSGNGWTISLGWTRDSATVLAAHSSGTGGSEIVAHPLDGSPSYRIYTTAMKVNHFAVADGVLALETDISRSNLARASVNPVNQPDIIDPASGMTWSPSFAPDGTLLFLSNRSGTNAIWMMKPGAAPSLLLDGGSTSFNRAVFSPDGSKMAVIYRASTTSAIKIMTRAGATTASFDVPSEGLGMPSWTRDGKAVITFDRRCLCAWRVEAADVTKRKVFAPPHWVGIADRESGTFSTRADKPGIWRIDQEIRQINDSYPRYYDPPMAFRGTDILVPEFDAGDIPRIMAQPESGGPMHLLAYAPGAQSRTGQAAFAVNPLNGEIIYTASVARDTNIDLLTLAKR
ncbi:MAG TPA: TIR domain-containing protein [Rhizomicrobium sp.]|nr:TIR domain-containing protein [Rhizomicrobium sp.]